MYVEKYRKVHSCWMFTMNVNGVNEIQNEDILLLENYDFNDLNEGTGFFYPLNLVE